MEAVKSFKDRLEKSNGELDRINAQYEEFIPAAEAEAEFLAIAEYEDQAIGMISTLQAHYSRLQAQSESSRQRLLGQDATATDVTSQRSELRFKGPKLPVLKITPFDGDYGQWTLFWEQFKGTIHDNAGLRNLYDHVDVHMRSLETAGVQPASYAAMLEEILTQSLPRQLAVEYKRQALQSSLSSTATVAGTEESSSAEASVAQADLKRLLNFLRIEVETREGSQWSQNNKTDEIEQGHKKGVRPKALPSASALHSSSATKEERLFCKQAHKTQTCASPMLWDRKSALLSKDFRCFRCTLKGHRAKDCKVRIFCSRCQGKHALAVCRKESVPKHAGESTNLAAQSTPCERSRPTASLENAVEVLPKTFRAWAVTPRRCMYVREVIDGGSDRTFVSEALASILRLPIVDEISLSITTFGSNKATSPQRRKIASLRLRSQYDMQEREIQAVVIPVICHDIRSASFDLQFVNELKERGKDLADELCFPGDMSCEDVSILIGSDHMWAILTGEILRKSESERLVALHSILGWTIQGPTPLSSQIEFQGHAQSHMATVACVLRAHSSVEVLGSTDDSSTWEPTLRAFWDIETMGLTTGKATSDHPVFEHFSQTIKKDGQRYDVTLPWKRDPVGFLEDNYKVALTRLKKLVARLKRTEGLLLRYDGVIREYFNLGHAEVVDTDAKSKGPVYYMPHSAVIREDRATTKVRVVFDASSHAPQCPSLNECLDKGVNLNPDILQLLIRFRSFKTALTADIEKAFLQVQVREKDRDVFRYIWFEQQPDCGTYVGDSEGLQTLRMTRVPFGATSSPFLLSATIQHHLNGIDGNLKATAEKLRKSFYVDDLVTGVDSEEEARKLYEDTMLIMKAAGMNLRKWTSNSVNLQVMFDGGLSCEATSSVSEILSPQKILGVSWDKARDLLQVSLKSLFTFLLETGDTKRFVLQASSRVFDPLGFMSPFTIRVKRLFQQLWIDGVEWDAKLPDQAQLEWKAWCTELPTLRLVSVCRHVGIYSSNGARHVTLYAFSDASMHAYGAVVYACAQESHSDVNLLVSKSRVAPLKELTLPRLELM
ncbi:uncharacterized protein LOC135369146 [Ornithodoros turicata]|uniref:uncharacterized protein LOC135369146 n=1 Tax=Ornithodoros turicata TaxID=34597 RepID=UPI003139A04B